MTSKRQLVLEAEDAPASQIEDNRAKLNAAYDSFVWKHGPMHARKASKVALTMPHGALALAAEAAGGQNGEAPSYQKSAIMSWRITTPPKRIERAEGIGDAVAITLSELGRIDLGRVAELLGTNEAEATAALSGAKSRAPFSTPRKTVGSLPTSTFRAWFAGSCTPRGLPGLRKNIAALQEVLPADWDASQITPNIGSTWIPPAVYAGFIKHLGYSNARVSHSPVTNTFSVWYDGGPRRNGPPHRRRTRPERSFRGF